MSHANSLRAATFLFIMLVPTASYTLPHLSRLSVKARICGSPRCTAQLNLSRNDPAETASDTPSPQSTRKRSRKKIVSNDDSIREFWTDENDDCIFITREGSSGNGDTDTSSSTRSAQFTIRGKPLPLIRHRSRRGFMYNPSAAAQEVFRDSLLGIMPQKHHPIIVDDGISGDAPITFFSPSDLLEVSIVFRMKRPKNHFVNNKPGEGRIKANAPGKFHATRTDIDNLAKFVLDSLNGLLYADDKQVVSLKLMKMLDSEGMCEGAIDVSVRVLYDEHFGSS